MAVTPFDPTYPKTPCCMQTFISQLCFRKGVIVDGSFTLREWEFLTFLVAPVTLTLTQWPSYRPTNIVVLVVALLLMPL